MNQEEKLKTLRQLIKEAGDRPLYQLAAERYAETTNSTTEAVLEKDRGAAENPTYPTAHCLLPEELEGLLDMGARFDEAGALSVDLDNIELLSSTSRNKLKHVHDCVFCKTMVTTLSPTAHKRQLFQNAVRKQTRDCLERIPKEEFDSTAVLDFSWAVLPAVITVIFIALAITHFELEASIQVGVSAALASAFLVLMGARLYYRHRGVLSSALRHAQGGIVAGLFLSLAFGLYWPAQQEAKKDLTLKLATEKVSAFMTNSLANKSTTGVFLHPPNSDKEQVDLSMIEKNAGKAIYEATIEGTTEKLIGEVHREGGDLFVIDKKAGKSLTRRFYVGKVEYVGAQNFDLITAHGRLVKVGQGSGLKPALGSEVVVALNPERNVSEQIQFISPMMSQKEPTQKTP